jgi:acyl-CoA synthetase (AMP-forming)/AMP-acid ligase II
LDCEDGTVCHGRLKDLIIISGRKLYPQDIELTVEESHRPTPGLLRGVFGRWHQEEQLIVAAKSSPVPTAGRNLEAHAHPNGRLPLDVEAGSGVRRAVAEEQSASAQGGAAPGRAHSQDHQRQGAAPCLPRKFPEGNAVKTRSDVSDV